MTLEELITALEAADPTLVLPHGFTNPHSYRGDYMDLAFEPASNVTVGDMLADARSALGTTYQGWKGGDFTMRNWTDCWLAMEGCLGETLGPLLVSLMLDAGIRDAAHQAAGQPAAACGCGEPGTPGIVHRPAAPCYVDETAAGLAAPTNHDTETPLTAVERQFLTFALNLADERMANRSDEFEDDDHAALASLRRLAAGAES